MLELLGVLGLLVAGAVGSAVFQGGSEPDSDSEDSDASEPEPGREPDSQTRDLAEDEPAPDPVAADPYASEPSYGVSGVAGAFHTEPVPDAGGVSDQTYGHGGPESSDRLPPPEEAPLRATGGPGDSQLFGGAAGDSLTGGDGNDTLTGGGGADLLVGGAGSDHLAGQEGDDRLEGGPGDDTLLGGRGDDLLIAGSGDNWLSGGMGNDLLIAGGGNDTLDGDEGDDTLSGNLGQTKEGTLRYLNGGRGDDLLIAGGGDVASGGAGADVFRLTGTGAVQITDYSAEDSLLVEYPSDGPAPVITFEPGSAGLRVLADGQLLADLLGVHDPDAVRLRLSAV